MENTQPVDWNSMKTAFLDMKEDANIDDLLDEGVIDKLADELLMTIKSSTEELRTMRKLSKDSFKIQNEEFKRRISKLSQHNESSF
jgi:hypothetical protein